MSRCLARICPHHSQHISHATHLRTKGRAHAREVCVWPLPDSLNTGPEQLAARHTSLAARAPLPVPLLAPTPHAESRRTRALLIDSPGAYLAHEVRHHTTSLHIDSHPHDACGRPPPHQHLISAGRAPASPAPPRLACIRPPCTAPRPPCPMPWALAVSSHRRRASQVVPRGVLDGRASPTKEPRLSHE